MPTVRDIVEHANVSISTVSLVLNEKPGVSDKMRQHVLQAAEELENQASKREQESQIRQRRLSIIVLHPQQVDDEVFYQTLFGLRNAAAKSNTQLQFVCNTPDVTNNGVAQLYLTNPDLIPDGLMALGVRIQEPFIDQALSLNIPVVLVQRSTEDAAMSSVGVDEVKIANEATTHLLELGHRSIAFVGGRPDYSYTHGRIEGYRQAMARYGITIPERWISMGWNDDTTRAVLDNCPEVTALVLIDDGFARDHALPVIEAAGLKIPEDLSVVSFDDIQEMREYEPPITSARFPFYEISYRAYQVLEEQIHNPQLRSQHIRFNASLQVRESCARIHQSV